MPTSTETINKIKTRIRNGENWQEMLGPKYKSSLIDHLTLSEQEQHERLSLNYSWLRTQDPKPDTRGSVNAGEAMAREGWIDIQAKLVYRSGGG